MTMPISDDLFLAILAMDSYNRSYNAGLSDSPAGLAGNQIGNAFLKTDVDLPVGSQAASFFAQAYNWLGQTVISYRGTDNRNPLDLNSDIYTGWPVGGGSYSVSQAEMAAKFYQTVVQGNDEQIKTKCAWLSAATPSPAS
jgi:hypothetical protein